MSMNRPMYNKTNSIRGAEQHQNSQGASYYQMQSVSRNDSID